MLSEIHAVLPVGLHREATRSCLNRRYSEPREERRSPSAPGGVRRREPTGPPPGCAEGHGRRPAAEAHGTPSRVRRALGGPSGGGSPRDPLPCAPSAPGGVRRREPPGPPYGCAECPGRRPTVGAHGTPSRVR